MSAQPTGTVTFLFTDIEDHTRMWDDEPDVMPGVLEQHDTILRSAIDRWDGYVFSTAGDSFSVAFARVEAAAGAAIEAQRAIRSVRWPATCDVRVRMGLHTGEAAERDGDYFGPAVIRAARLMSVGHGHQLLVSEATTRLLADQPEYTEMLRPLGKVVLRGLGRVEAVHELRYPGLVEEFPPLSAQKPELGNLPRIADKLIGRNDVLADAMAMVSAGPLVTLTGPGGIGKTRLAIEIGSRSGARFGDGVWFVPLASVTEESAVPNAVADTLGVQEARGMSLTESIVGAVAGRDLLLVLDNCEHVVGGAREMGHSLVEAGATVSVLATSREPLGIAGERVVLVEPLPTDDAAGSSWSAAVELFVRRAQAADRSFVADDATADTVREMCVHLDGMPLAIELAAARIRGFGLDGLRDHLDHRFRLLRARDVREPRHQSLRATVAWSFELLEPPLQELFLRAGGFASGFTSDAAEEVLAFGDLDPLDVADGLAELVDKSMLQAEDSSLGRRYRMLESMRQYAAELIEVSTRAAVERRLVDHYVAWAEQANRELHGPNPATWFTAVDTEFDNLRDVFRLATAAGDSERAARLVVALHEYSRSHVVSEPRSWAAALLDRVEIDRPLHADVVAVAVGGARSSRGRATTSELISRVERAEAEGRVEPSAFCDQMIGVALWFRGQTDRAIALQQRAVDKARALRGHADESLILATLSMAQDAIDRDRAASSARAAVEAARDADFPIGVTLGLLSLAGVVIHDGPDEALPIIDELITVAQEHGGRWALASGLRIRAHALSRADRLTEASAGYTAALELNGVGDFGELLWYSVLNILEHLGRIDRPESAAIAVGKISSARGAPRDALVQRSLERSRRALDDRLGADRRTALEAEGQAMTLAEFLNRLDHDLRQHAVG